MRHDRKATDPILETGERVLLKRNAFTGRHKLADKFFDASYIIVNKNEEGDIYEVKPFMGGVSRWVNRRQLIIDPRGREQEVLRDVLPNPIHDAGRGLDPLLDPGDEEIFEEDNISDDDDGDDYHTTFQWVYSTPAVADGSESAGDSGPRRSSRVSKGVNPNPGRLQSQQ